jgi:flagellar FliJ protein
MSQPGALEILIDLAAKQSDARTRDLGQALKAETSEGKRLAMLRDYRTGYLATLAKAQQRGMSSGMLINYNHFLSRLDAAIGQQEAVVDRAKGHTEAARSKLNEAERKRKSLVTISDRRAAAERVAAGRREQKQHDEISNRVAVHGNGVTQPMRIVTDPVPRSTAYPPPGTPPQDLKTRK